MTDRTRVPRFALAGPKWSYGGTRESVGVELAETGMEEVGAEELSFSSKCLMNYFTG